MHLLPLRGVRLWYWGRLRDQSHTISISVHGKSDRSRRKVRRRSVCRNRQTGSRGQVVNGAKRRRLANPGFLNGDRRRRRCARQKREGGQAINSGEHWRRVLPRVAVGGHRRPRCFRRGYRGRHAVYSGSHWRHTIPNSDKGGHAIDGAKHRRRVSRRGGCRGRGRRGVCLDHQGSHHRGGYAVEAARDQKRNR